MTEQCLNFTAIFNAYVEANQKTWANDRGLTVGASEAFACLRSVWYEKRAHEFGIKADSGHVSWGAMERGNLIENYYVVPAMKHLPEGMSLLYAGEDQNTLVVGKNSATPDGLIVGLDPTKPLIVRYGEKSEKKIEIDLKGATCVTFEIKSIDPRSTLLEEKEKHHFQTQIQIAMFHEKTEHRPTGSIILYIDASFIDNITPFYVEYNPEVFVEAKARANAIWEVDDPMMIVPEGRLGDDCEHCRWRTACGSLNLEALDRMKNEAEFNEELAREIDPIVTEYLDAQERVKAAERAQKAAAERVKEFLLDNSVRKVPGDAWNVSWSKSPGKKKLDRNAMQADGIDLDQYTTEGNPFDVLRVTRKKAKDENDGK